MGDTSQHLEEFRHTAPKGGFVDRLIFNRIQDHLDKRASQETLAYRAGVELKVQAIEAVNHLDKLFPGLSDKRSGEIRDETNRMLADFDAGLQETLHGQTPDLETLEIMATHASHLKRGDPHEASALKFGKSKFRTDIDTTADVIHTIKEFEETEEEKYRNPQKLLESVYRIFCTRLVERNEIPTLLSDAKVAEYLRAGKFSPSAIREAEKELAGKKPDTERMFVVLNKGTVAPLSY